VAADVAADHMDDLDVGAEDVGGDDEE
jgi:hypothetical protein